ncbi:GDSL Lipase/Acylhydrolase [Ramaria rubella]|nr:GDSL Lipase/Acylhydrolase [Ramaria rubella]
MAANVLDTILLYGDSITQGGWQPHGFAQSLAYVYARKLDVINRGMSGYNTEWAIPVFEQIIAKKSEQPYVPKIALLTLWFGANDACIPPSPQHVPLPKFASNLAHFVRMIKSPDSEYYSSSTRILLFTPPPINTFQRGADLLSRNPPLALDRTFETTKSYADMVKEVGEKEGVPVLDVWTALYSAADEDEKQLERFLNDGLHLNAAGYEIVFNLLIDKIHKEFPELHYDKLPPVFSPWSDVNVHDPRSSLRANRVEL